MNLTQEQMGSVCHYLDIGLTILRGAGIMTTVYRKRDSMPVFAPYRRFPQRLSHISGRAKHNVFGFQLHRFAVICSTWDGFTKNTSRLLHEMLTHGYSWKPLKISLIMFWATYRMAQLKVHANRVRTARGRFRTLAWRNDGTVAHWLLGLEPINGSR